MGLLSTEQGLEALISAKQALLSKFEPILVQNWLKIGKSKDLRIAAMGDFLISAMFLTCTNNIFLFRFQLRYMSSADFPHLVKFCSPVPEI